MIRTIRFIVGASLLSLVLTASSWGQQPGPQAGGGPSGLYNPATVITVSGIVIAKTPSSPKGFPQLVYLTLKTETDKVAIFLGPDLYVNKLPVQIHNLDKIQVTGSEITWEGKPVILAATIKTGDQVLKLREPNGVPVWSGKGRANP
jgi:hypothetical protein